MNARDNPLATELLRQLIPISRTTTPRLRVSPADFVPPKSLAEIGIAAIELQKLGYARFHLEDAGCFRRPTCGRLSTNMASGRIYILSNPCIPNLVKIGKTAASPEIRAKQLSQFAGVPTSFRVVDSHFTLNIHSSEARVFRALRDYRWNHAKEFFHLHPADASKIVRTLLLEAALNKPEYAMAKTQLARTLVIKRYERLKGELRNAIDRKGSNQSLEPTAGRCQVHI